MRFNPKTEEEIDMEGLLVAGIYDFDVVKANDKTSKNGNDMIELNICVFGENNQRSYVWDYLLPDKMAYKLRHFADATNQLDKYESGELTARDCMAQKGKLHLGIQEAKDGYPAKNIVKDYVKREMMDKVNTAASISKEDDDQSIPF